MEKIKRLVNLIPKSGQEIIKEVLRWFVFAVVSYYLRGGEITTAVIQTIVFRILDRVVHTYGKDHDISWLIKGLTRF